jgi:hypothetical protein
MHPAVGETDCSMPGWLSATEKHVLPARRFAGALVAVFVLLQSSATVTVWGSRVASCCCKHHDGSVKCRCPACAHGRELEAGCPVLKSCDSGSGLKAEAFSRTAMLAAVERALPAPRRQAPPPILQDPLHEPPDLDVDTPPPLA